MSVLFKLPYFLPNNEILWLNNDYTFVIGYNGSGKTILLNKMAEWAESHNYSYAFYDSQTSLSLAPQLMEQASDEEIIEIAKMIMDISPDFRDDVFDWLKAKNDDQTIKQIRPDKDVEMLREIFSMCGSGYTRMFTMLYLGLEKPELDYYFLDMPETSLHLLFARKVLDILMKNFPNTKFVITTHSPAIIDDKWDSDNIIDLSEQVVHDTAYHECDEVFC